MSAQCAGQGTGSRRPRITCVQSTQQNTLPVQAETEATSSWFPKWHTHKQDKHKQIASVATPSQAYGYTQNNPKKTK